MFFLSFWSCNSTVVREDSVYKLNPFQSSLFYAAGCGLSWWPATWAWEGVSCSGWGVASSPDAQQPGSVTGGAPVLPAHSVRSPVVTERDADVSGATVDAPACFGSVRFFWASCSSAVRCTRNVTMSSLGTSHLIPGDFLCSEVCFSWCYCICSICIFTSVFMAVLSFCIL